MKRSYPWLCGSALAALLVMGSASPAVADTIIVDIGNDPQYSWTWAENLNLGYEFTVSTPLTFNALAVFDVISADPATSHSNALGLNASHQVGVWSSGGVLLASTTVNPGDPRVQSTNTYGNWVYHLVTPTTLSAGTYTIGAFYPGGLSTSDPVMVQQTAIANSGVSYVGGRYLYSDTFGRPTGGPFADNEQQYFGPTLMSIPDGGMTLTLLGGALIALGALRYRTNS